MTKAISRNQAHTSLQPIIITTGLIARLEYIDSMVLQKYHKIYVYYNSELTISILKTVIYQ